MKRFGFVLLFLVIAFGATIVGSLFWWRSNTAAVSEKVDFISFVVPKGKSAMQVGNMLFDKELIKSPLTFKIYVQFFGKSKAINAGEFKLSSNMDLFEIVEALGKGPLELWVTIPEGLRREEIVEKFINGLEIDNTKAVEFRQTFLNLTKDKEGYLFPDTYLFPRDAEAPLVVTKLTETFNSKTQEYKDSIGNSDYSLNQLITMASIIERETKTVEERAIVAGILFKRIETAGWLLQADATNQYIAGSENCKLNIANCDSWWPILTKQDLEIDSPYNSYQNKNLPPTPIANPGLTSIEAAIFPESSQYWFYIHDPEGNIHFAKSINEHNANVRTYLGK